MEALCHMGLSNNGVKHWFISIYMGKPVITFGIWGKLFSDKAISVHMTIYTLGDLYLFFEPSPRLCWMSPSWGQIEDVHQLLDLDGSPSKLVIEKSTNLQFFSPTKPITEDLLIYPAASNGRSNRATQRNSLGWVHWRHRDRCHLSPLRRSKWIKHLLALIPTPQSCLCRCWQLAFPKRPESATALTTEDVLIRFASFCLLAGPQKA